MRSTRLALICLVVLVCVLAFVCAEDRHFPEFTHRIPAPSQWKPLYKVNDMIKSNLKAQVPFITVTIALKHRNVAWLRETFEQVSDPDSPKYGQHVTFEEINQRIAPDLDQFSTVVSWLKAAHSSVEIVHVAPGKDFIKAKMPVFTAQELFQCEFTVYRHESRDATVIRSEGPYSIPRTLSNSIAFVGNLIRFPKVNTLKNLSAPAPVNMQVNPNVIRDYYNITQHPTKPFAKNAQAVASFLEQYYNADDLNRFWNKYNIQKLDIKVIGPNPQSSPGLEAALDIEYITGVGEGIPTWFVSCPGLHEGQETFLEWIVNMTSLGDETPYVHSVSYGDIEDSISIDYATRLDEEFMKFGAAGRTVLIASGDNGVRCNNAGTKFVPEWPTSSPWITSVGATQPTGSGHEESSTSWSGGGFSNYYGAPKYQIEAIAKYWENQNLPPRSFYNVTGRAYPDVSAFGVNFDVAFQGFFTSVGGTSASTPTFAGIVSLLNNYRLQVKKKPLGFLNFMIYKRWGTTNGFKDIVSGRNGEGACPGFPATPGWDPVTGFGTPNVGMLRILAEHS